MIFSSTRRGGTGEEIHQKESQRTESAGPQDSTEPLWVLSSNLFFLWGGGIESLLHIESFTVWKYGRLYSKLFDSAPVRVVLSYSLVCLFDEKRWNVVAINALQLQQRRTIILLRDTAEELMTAQFDLRLTNQQKGVFNSHA